ncbi:HAMP domain-containing histidine kinase [Candidatus Saccharibacteria bacterium]|nr:HAMP domain-containing histidine kinase [Candidatus Saccharibacteria bacterium]
MITMVATTVVLILAGGSVMFFSSALRPEPKTEVVMVDMGGMSFDLMDHIKDDREEGDVRLAVTLVSVGVAIEIIVFITSYYLSEKMVAPVKDAYDKQKLFIANASHELKTPLAVIQANMEAMEVSQDNRKWKDNVETEITRANKLVLDLLQLAKMDAGGASGSEAEKVDLGVELEKRVEMFRPKFGGKIDLRCKGETEHLLPKQDILQVVDILLDNATKYGEKKVSVVLGQDRIEIINDGVTVAEKDQTKIFDRFYQTDKTREGSGLGLAIAKAICEQNNWQIACEGNRQRTKFLVSFAK